MLKTRMVMLIAVVIGFVAEVRPTHAQQTTRPKPGQARGPFLLGLAFSRDSSLVATCGDLVRVLDVESDKLLSELDANSKTTRAVEFSPANRDMLAVAGDDGIVRLWRVGQPEVVRELKGHDGWVLSLAFDPTGQRLISGSTKYQKGNAALGQLRLWDVASGERLQALDLKDGGVTGVSFSSDGELLAYCSQSQVHVQRVRGWERLTSIPLTAAKLENGPHGKASPFGLATLFVQDNSRLIIGGGICVPVSKEESAPYDFACTTTGLLWGAALYDPTSAKLLEEPRIGYRFRLSLSPDGQRFATSVERENKKGNPDPKIELRDVASGKLIWKVDADRGTPYGLAISPSGKLVACLAYDAVNLFDLDTGKFIRKISLIQER